MSEESPYCPHCKEVVVPRFLRDSHIPMCATLTAARSEIESLKRDRDLWKRQSEFESEHRERYRTRLSAYESALSDSEEVSRAVEELGKGHQADEDGVMITVSREARDKTIAALRAAQVRIGELEKEVGVTSERQILADKVKMYLDLSIAWQEKAEAAEARESALKAKLDEAKETIKSAASAILQARALLDGMVLSGRVDQHECRNTFQKLGAWIMDQARTTPAKEAKP